MTLHDPARWRPASEAGVGTADDIEWLIENKLVWMRVGTDQRGRIGCGFPMADKPSNRPIVVALIVGTLPFGLWFVLNFLRPDLVGAMLDHQFGHLVTLAEIGLSFGGLAAYLLAATALRDRKGLRYGVRIAAALLCTLPAMFWLSSGRSSSRSCSGTSDDPARDVQVRTYSIARPPA